MNRVFTSFALLLAAAACSAAEPTTLTGQWAIHQSIAGNDSDQQCKFVQADNKLTGSCVAEGKESPITGTVDGKKITWKYNSEYNGSPITLTYTATFDDSGKFAGSVDVEPFAVSGDFTATQSKDAAK